MMVLPFDNLSDDKEQGYLADGMSEDLTTELARVPGLLVMSRTAAFTYKDKKVRPDQIAREMHVRYILEGSVRRAGDDMRINAQLIDATTGDAFVGRALRRRLERCAHPAEQGCRERRAGAGASPGPGCRRYEPGQHGQSGGL